MHHVRVGRAARRYVCRAQRRAERRRHVQLRALGRQRVGPHAAMPRVHLHGRRALLALGALLLRRVVQTVVQPCGVQPCRPHGAIDCLVASKVPEPIEGLVVADQEELAELVRNGDGAAARVAGVTRVGRPRVRSSTSAARGLCVTTARVQHERRVRVARAGPQRASEGLHALQRGNSGAQLDRRRRVEVRVAGGECARQGPAAAAAAASTCPRCRALRLAAP
mmetsp:Transcript_6914/g.20840  ORF Transcript_6914/g.20840 Transcript_6914/m.20840 type:complete len:223 (-) Transcript_6914:121-789(-)